MGKEKGRVHVHPSEVEPFLIGLDYPATREEIILHAESQKAPEDIADVLYRIPDRRYDNPADITYEIWKL
jgi:hypothetical protein